MIRFLFFAGFLFFTKSVFSQKILTGVVTDDKSQPISGVAIFIKSSNRGTTTDDNGKYQLELKDSNSTLVFQHIAFIPKEHTLSDTTEVLQITLTPKTEYLKGVEVVGRPSNEILSPSITRIDPKAAEVLPSPFGDFTRILATLPGVVSNNELSSTYSVRGGNFDENLVYVNDIPIYRPQLITAGQQEGLGFVNTNLVNNVTFSAGGWQARHGDKLSSVLDVKYKNPTQLHASATLGLLGGQAHFENQTKNKRISYILGTRHKRAEYLLASLETKGEYLPRFTDIQALIHFNIGNKQNPAKTTLSVLSSYARNRYQVTPASRETEFGTFNRSFRLFVAFIGQELLQYDTYQGGVKINHQFSDKWTSQLIVSMVKSSEREYKNVEGGYRLCDIDTDISSKTFNKCLITRGIGTNFEYSRNILKANMVYTENSHEVALSNSNILKFGIGATLQQFDDQFNEHNFKDSSEYIVELQAVNTTNRIRNDQVHAYVQNTSTLSEKSTLNIGVRTLYSLLNRQVAISPRIQYSYAPDWERDVIFKLATGWYYQPPLYRELRDYKGVLHKNTPFQKSMHFIAGIDYRLKIWNRNFTFISEMYYKKIARAIAYDVDNVRIRYYPDLQSSAYATGVDFRLSGEFIPGTVSWFSLGILSTKERLEGIKEEIRRPSDQRFNFGIFFQDHIPGDPTWRVNLSLQVGSGLPFGPPNDLKNRSNYTGAVYRRVDVGFTKEVSLSKVGDYPKLLIGLDVLNLLGVSNTISYTWIQDVVGQEFAIPNGLSTRFFNFKVTFRM